MKPEVCNPNGDEYMKRQRLEFNQWMVSQMLNDYQERRNSGFPNAPVPQPYQPKEAWTSADNAAFNKAFCAWMGGR